jgi:hypothetical protein
MSAVFMERMITRIKEDGGEALRIFGTSFGIDEQGGAGISVVRRFVDRLVGEVVCQTLLRPETCPNDLPFSMPCTDRGVRIIAVITD